MFSFVSFSYRLLYHFVNVLRVFDLRWWRLSALLSESSDEIQGVEDFEVGESMIADDKFSDLTFQLFRPHRSVVSDSEQMHVFHYL